MKQYEFDPNIKALVCQNIKKYRNIKKISLMELAEAVDVTPEHLKRIESVNDRNNISLITLYKISVVLNVSIDKFFKE
jgi:transcriptional regulator with XRE-family HTH domain